MKSSDRGNLMSILRQCMFTHSRNMKLVNITLLDVFVKIFGGLMELFILVFEMIEIT